MITQEAKKLILDAKNICIVPSGDREPESLSAALALFYTLKELRKNVNLIADDFPENLQFLVPSLDFISQPQSFVISIPRSAADVSQIYYEKNEDSLKINLTLSKGQIKKDDISFYVSNAKPDLIIALGIADFQKQLSGKLDSFGFLLDAPTINIDRNQDNTKFGAINIIEPTSISQITMDVVSSISHINKNSADCLLAGLIIFYDNFKNINTSPEIFQITSDLIKKGAEYNRIIENIYRSTEKEIHFLRNIFERMKFANGISTAELESSDFLDFSETQAHNAVEKIKLIGMQNDLLVLWRSHNSAPMIKGFFYSRKANIINKFAEHQNSILKNGWVFLQIPGENVAWAKDEILKIL